MEGAREALIDLPPRSEPELDPVTLHNLSLTDTSGTGTGLRRLAFLLELGPPTCPPETFANILLLCCKHEMYDTAADMLAEHAHLTYKYLSPVSLMSHPSQSVPVSILKSKNFFLFQYLYDLLDALITVQTSPEDAEEKLGVLSSQLAGRLRSLSAKVQEYRVNSDQESLRKTLKEYETALEKYVQ